VRASDHPAPAAARIHRGGARAADVVRPGHADPHAVDADRRGHLRDQRLGRRRLGPRAGRGGGDRAGGCRDLDGRRQRPDQPRDREMGSRRSARGLEADEGAMGALSGRAVVAAAGGLRADLRVRRGPARRL
ncbi:MAG: hypothetical protein AVDCRST_MAG67-1129, partial [uncultured Solirubrobacteraceae bacterium]